MDMEKLILKLDAVVEYIKATKDINIIQPLNNAFDDLLESDVFGTEGQLDPRGDQRNAYRDSEYEDDYDDYEDEYERFAIESLDDAIKAIAGLIELIKSDTDVDDYDYFYEVFEPTFQKCGLI
jgi:hypothetical protein